MSTVKEVSTGSMLEERMSEVEVRLHRTAISEHMRLWAPRGDLGSAPRMLWGRQNLGINGWCDLTYIAKPPSWFLVSIHQNTS